MTPTIASTQAAGGAVRRKPARRANTAERRATHNAVERQRRETLNGRFLDLAALLPNLATVRRPSKSAIVNSSIALVHTQRRFRAIAARELRALAHEAENLRREVNEWRAAFPGQAQSVPSAALNNAEGANNSTLEAVLEPVRSADFVALMELEEVSEEEMSMNEQERIAYEMRGGDSGPLAASFGEDGEDEYGVLGGLGGEDDLSDGQRFVAGQQTPAAASTSPSVVRTNAGARARAQSLTVPRLNQQQQVAQQQQQYQQQPANLAQLQQQLQLNTQQAQAAAALIPSSYHHPSQMQHAAQLQAQSQNQLAQSQAQLQAQAQQAHAQQAQQAALLQQQQQQQQYVLQQHQLQQQAMQMAAAAAASSGFAHSFLPPTFDAIAAAAAGFQHPSQGSNVQTPGANVNNEQEAAKLAAWNAHLFSAALAAQRDQQQQQFNAQFQTPPSSGHGAAGPFGSQSQAQAQQQQSFLQHFQRAGEQQMQQQQMQNNNNQTQNQNQGSASSENGDEMDGGVSTPSSRSSVPPSLSLSISSLSSAQSQSQSPSMNSPSSLAGAGGMPSSLPSALASPLHNLSLGQQQQDFGFGSYASSAPGVGGNWGSLAKGSPVGTPVGQTPPPLGAVPATGGGGGGMGGYNAYPMMSMFI